MSKMNTSTESILQAIPQPALFQKIGEICAAVTTVITEKELLDVSLRKTLDLFGANRGSIFILDAKGEKLTMMISHGMKISEQKQMVKRLGEGIVGRVAALKKPMVVENIGDDSRFNNFKARKSYSTSSFICAPLLVKDQLIGVINFADKKCGGKFNKDELQLLDFLSSQIALNYRRVQLYYKFKEIVKESQTLKNKLGESSKEADDLKSKIIKHEKLATIGKLAGGIAHEFNNPLDGVLRYTNLCLEQVDSEDVVHGYLLEVKHGLNRMVKIVKNLLACSRNESPSDMKVDPNRIIDLAINSVQSEIFQNNISVKKDVIGELPPIVDLGLEQAVSNLLRNAIDAVNSGDEVTVSAEMQGDLLVVKVRDSGQGIDDEHKMRIFEPFYTTKNIEKGCGLGLTIVGEVVKSYNGEIKLDSEPGKGSTFAICIPTAE